MNPSYRIVLLLCIAWIAAGVYCGSRDSDTEIHPVEHALTNVLSIGPEDMNDPYFLVKPHSFTVAEDGGVIVADIKTLKVFDTDGADKAIIGEGSGVPGGFGKPVFPASGPGGYFTVIDGVNDRYKAFGPKFEYLGETVLREDSRYVKLFESMQKRLWNILLVIPLNEDERIVQLNVLDIEDGQTEVPEILLVHETPGNLKIIARYRSSRVFITGSVTAQFPFRGILLADCLPNGEIVYCHPFHDSRLQGGRHSYTLHVYSPENGSNREISHSYDPVSVPDSVKTRWDITKKYKFFQEITETVFSESDTYAPLHNLHADGGRIFAFTHHENSAGEFLADVFDAEAWEYCGSGYFDVPERIVLDQVDVRDGFLYTLFKKKYGFGVIEKYRIDPALYEW